KPSILAGDWLPPPIHMPLFVLGAIAYLLMGYLTAVLVRPRNVLGDIATGTATGTAAGLVTFALGLGPAFVLSFGVVVALEDLTMLQQGYTTCEPRPLSPDAVEKPPHPQDTLITKYPDLETLPEHERPTLLYSKIVADIVTGTFAGIWVGILASLGFGWL